MSAQIDPADVDEARAAAKYGKPFAFVMRAVGYGDDLEKLTAGISKCQAVDGGAWQVAFETPHGLASMPAHAARAWADQMDTPAAQALGGFDTFVATLRAMADQCDQINQAVPQ